MSIGQDVATVFASWLEGVDVNRLLRIIVDGIECEFIGAEYLDAVVIIDVVADRDDSVEVQGWLKGIGAVFVVGERAVIGFHINDAEGVTVSIGKALQQVVGVNGVQLIFFAVGQDLLASGEFRRFVNTNNLDVE